MGSCAHLRSLDGKILLVGWYGAYTSRVWRALSSTTRYGAQAYSPSPPPLPVHLVSTPTAACPVTVTTDNGLVCAASTVHRGITGSAARLTQKLKDQDPEARRTLVMANRRRKGPGGGYVTQAAPQPKLIADYTAAMGGTFPLSRTVHRSALRDRQCGFLQQQSATVRSLCWQAWTWLTSSGPTALCTASAKSGFEPCTTGRVSARW